VRPQRLDRADRVLVPSSNVIATDSSGSARRPRRPSASSLIVSAVRPQAAITSAWRAKSSGATANEPRAETLWYSRTGIGGVMRSVAPSGADGRGRSLRP
jgi:hypothetical protein